MSGIAIVLSGCDFSQRNLGKVTFLEDSDVTGISISGDSNIAATSAVFSIIYTPVNTSQTGVTWSIINGSQYASINSATGVLTILPGAVGSSVTIQAVSLVDNTITASKTIAVTFQEAPILLESISISGNSTVSGASAQYTAAYTPLDTTQKGIVWSIQSGGSFATINSETGKVTILSGASAAAVVIKAMSTVNNSIYATKSLTLTYEAPQIGRKMVIAAPYSAAGIQTKTPETAIAGVYWNNNYNDGNACFAWYNTKASTNVKDTSGVTMCQSIHRIADDTDGALAHYLDSAIGSAWVSANATGLSVKDCYTVASGFANNTGYPIDLFAGMSGKYGSSDFGIALALPMVLKGLQSGTYTVRLYVVYNSAEYYSANNRYVVNGVEKSYEGSMPDNPLNSPLVWDNVQLFGNSLLFYAYALASVAFRGAMSMIEIERTA